MPAPITPAILTEPEISLPEPTRYVEPESVEDIEKEIEKKEEKIIKKRGRPPLTDKKTFKKWRG